MDEHPNGSSIVWENADHFAFRITPAVNELLAVGLVYFKQPDPTFCDFSLDNPHHFIEPLNTRINEKTIDQLKPATRILDSLVSERV